MHRSAALALAFAFFAKASVAAPSADSIIAVCSNLDLSFSERISMLEDDGWEIFSSYSSSKSAKDRLLATLALGNAISGDVDTAFAELYLDMNVAHLIASARKFEDPFNTKHTIYDDGSEASLIAATYGDSESLLVISNIESWGPQKAICHFLTRDLAPDTGSTSENSPHSEYQTPMGLLQIGEFGLASASGLHALNPSYDSQHTVALQDLQLDGLRALYYDLPEAGSFWSYQRTR